MVGLDFLKVVRLVFWSGVVGPGTNVELSLARASRSLWRYALKSSTCEQVCGWPDKLAIVHLANQVEGKFETHLQ